MSLDAATNETIDEAMNETVKAMNETMDEATNETVDKAMKNSRSLQMEIASTLLLTVACFLFLRGAIAEARVIPSGSMLPTLQINDRIVVEKVSTRILGRSIERGDILVFYPPKIETGMVDSNSILNIIPFVPEKPPAFIKRVVGLPGDKIEVEKGIGIFVNGKLVSEAIDIPKPDYDLHSLGDIGGIAMTGAYVQPFGNSRAPIIVPPAQLFMLGDNHNNSGDSHVWGFLDENRVIGRDCFTIWRDQWLSPKKGS
jgi:signal peptidase I